MAIIPKLILATDQTAESLFIIDQTGEYSALNVGGYGTPNEDLSQLALVGYIERIDHLGAATPLDAVSGSIYQNTAATNDQEENIEFTYLGDGHHKATLFAIKTSDDGVNYNAGGTILDQEYFYQAGAVFQKQGATQTEITDYATMVGVTSVLQESCEDIRFARLTVQMGKLWQEFKDFRNNECVQDADDVYKKIETIRFNMIGSDYDFRSGLVGEARKNIKMLIDEYLEP